VVRKEPAAPPQELPDQEARVLGVFLDELLDLSKPDREGSDTARLVSLLPLELFSHRIAREILTVLKEFLSQPGTLDFSSLTTHLGADAGPVAARLLHDEGEQRAADADKAGTEGLGRIHIPLLQLKIRLLEDTAKNLQPEIQKAAVEGDLPAREAATRRKQELAEEIRRLKAELKAEMARRI